jgi:HlyD family secretion protein
MQAAAAPIDDAKRVTRLGLATTAAVAGGFVAWSVFAPISSAVIAPGEISVESNRKTIQHLDGGVVSEIAVKEGSAVKAGDLLVRLDDTVTGAGVSLLTEQLAEAIARHARLLAERDGLAEIPSDSLAFGLAPADLDYAANLDGQKRLLAARAETRRTQTALLDERVVQQNERIDGFNTQAKSVRAQARLIADELRGVKELNAQGFAPMTRVRALEREREALEGRLGALAASVAEAESVINEARLEIERLKQQTREDAITESQDLAVEIANLVERRVAALEALSRSEIRAPEDGVVLGLAVHTIGGVVAAGERLMDIVPKDDRLVITAQIAPSDVDKVRPGQAAVIRFPAFNARVTPEARGAVRTVSADNVVDDKTGAPYYAVLVDLPSDEQLDAALKGQPLVPGMPAEIYIQTGARSALSYFLKPLTDAFSGALREE